MRLTAAVVTVLGLAGFALAIPSPRIPGDSAAARRKLEEKPVKPLVLESQKDNYRITEKTKVILDGRPCKYESVPADAIIEHMEIVSNTNKEILKIVFRTAPPAAKKPAKRSAK